MNSQATKFKLQGNLTEMVAALETTATARWAGFAFPSQPGRMVGAHSFIVYPCPDCATGKKSVTQIKPSHVIIGYGINAWVLIILTCMLIGLLRIRTGATVSRTVLVAETSEIAVSILHERQEALQTVSQVPAMLRTSLWESCKVLDIWVRNWSLIYFSFSQVQKQIATTLQAHRIMTFFQALVIWIWAQCKPIGEKRAECRPSSPWSSIKQCLSWTWRKA